MKKNKPEVVYTRNYVCAVFVAEYTEAVSSIHIGTLQQDKYAVFVRPEGAERFVQVSKWFTYKGAAINKMCRMYHF